jgi:predicted nucleic acid-binding protein
VNLNDIKTGDRVVLDANIFLYAIQNSSNQCRTLLERCAKDELAGVLPSHILAEVMHQLMLAEARANAWIRAANPARQLGRQPERIKQLSRYVALVQDILAIGLAQEPLAPADFISAMAISRQAGLLTNDSLLASVAQRLRIDSVASADRHFERVAGITLYSPDDLQE